MNARAANLPRSTPAPASTVMIGGSEYRRTGPDLFHVQVQSWRGGYLSTAATTRTREHVGGFALAQAELLSEWKEARRPCFNDSILQVTNQELSGASGYNQGRKAVVSCYRWDPKEGRWSHSSGTRITAIDSMGPAETPAWTLPE